MGQRESKEGTKFLKTLIKAAMQVGRKRRSNNHPSIAPESTNSSRTKLSSAQMMKIMTTLERQLTRMMLKKMKMALTKTSKILLCKQTMKRSERLNTRHSSSIKWISNKTRKRKQRKSWKLLYLEETRNVKEVMLRVDSAMMKMILRDVSRRDSKKESKCLIVKMIWKSSSNTYLKAAKAEPSNTSETNSL